MPTAVPLWVAKFLMRCPEWHSHLHLPRSPGPETTSVSPCAAVHEGVAPRSACWSVVDGILVHLFCTVWAGP